MDLHRGRDPIARSDRVKWGLVALALLLVLGLAAWALDLQPWHKILSEVVGLIVVGVVFLFILQQRSDWKRLGREGRQRSMRLRDARNNADLNASRHPGRR